MPISRASSSQPSVYKRAGSKEADSTVSDTRLDPIKGARRSRLSLYEPKALEDEWKGKECASSDCVSEDDDNDSRGSPWTIEAVDGELNDGEVCLSFGEQEHGT